MKSSKPREWTELEVKTLISMTGQQHRADEISKSLGRYVGSVKTKARQLGLVPVKKPKPAGAGLGQPTSCLEAPASMANRSLDPGIWPKREDGTLLSAVSRSTTAEVSLGRRNPSLPPFFNHFRLGGVA